MSSEDMSGCRLRYVGPSIGDHRNRFQPQEQSLSSSFGGTNRCGPAANAEHDKRPRATTGLANPVLAAVHDDCLTGDKGGIVAC